MALHYGLSGKKRINLHAVQNEEKHLKNKVMFFLKNITRPASWIEPNKVAKRSDVCSHACNFCYSVSVNVHDSEVCSSRHSYQSKPVASVKYHTLNSVVFILSFAVEDSYHYLKYLNSLNLQFFFKGINA